MVILKFDHLVISSRQVVSIKITTTGENTTSLWQSPQRVMSFIQQFVCGTL